MRRSSAFFAILIILIMTIAFWGRVIFTGKVLLPADMLLKELPWGHYGSVSHLQNHYLSDALHAFYPMKTLISERLKSGEFPLWLPEVSCGYPLFASGFHDVIGLSGFLLLLADVPLAHNLLFILQLFLAGTFMYFFLRTIKVGFWGAIVSAVAFMLNFLFMSYLLFEHIVGAMLWLPLICLFLEKFHSRGKFAYLLLAGLFMGLAVLNGSIQSMLYVFLAVFIYFAYHGCRSARNAKSLRPLFKSMLIFSLIVLIGFSVAAVKLIPTFEFFLGWNQRDGGFAFGRWLTTLWKKPLAIPLLSGFVFPDLLGSHRALDVTKVLGDMGGREGISGNVFKAYIGILPFMFAFIAVFYRRCEKSRLFVWMSVAPILLIMFTPLYLFLYFRGFVVYIFAACVLAGLGVDWLINSENREVAARRITKGLKWILIIGFVALVIGNLFLYAFRDKILSAGHSFIRARAARAGWLNYDMDWQLGKVDNMLAHYSILNHRMYLPFAIGGMCFVLLWAFGKSRIGTTAFMIMVVLVVFFDLSRLGWDYIPMVDRDLVFPETESVKFLKQDKSLFRINTRWDKAKDPPVFPPNTLLPYGISNVKVYASLIPPQGFIEERFHSLLNVKYVIAPPGTQMPQNLYSLAFDGDVWIYENREVLPRAYMVQQARFVETEEDALTEMYSADFDPGKTVVIVGSARLGSLDDPSPEHSVVEVARYAPSEVEVDVDSTNGGFLVLSDRYYPGWKVFVDGKESPMYKANYVFRAVQLDKGRHRVSFSFGPYLFRLGLYISIVSVIFVIVGACVMRRQYR